MRIYNGTKATLTLPYSGGENLTIAPKTPSGNVLCTNDFIKSLVTSYNTDEVAIIAAGPFEITACANIPTAVNYVVQSLDEAIKRFSNKPKDDEQPSEDESGQEPSDENQGEIKADVNDAPQMNETEEPVGSEEPTPEVNPVDPENVEKEDAAIPGEEFKADHGEVFKADQKKKRGGKKA